MIHRVACIRNTRDRFFLALLVSLMLIFTGCKSDSKADPSLDAFGPDTLTTQDNTRKTSGSAPPAAEGSHKSIPSRKTSSPQQGASSAAQSASSTGGVNPGDGSSGAMIRPEGPSGKKWWDNRTTFFTDWVGGTGDIVYEAVKGQKYYPETKIFIYSTDKAMEGSMNYSKTQLTMKETELDDRIFIWVHLDDNRKPLFVKTLISDNIKDKIQSAPLKL